MSWELLQDSKYRRLLSGHDYRSRVKNWPKLKLRGVPIAKWAPHHNQELLLLQSKRSPKEELKKYYADCTTRVKLTRSKLVDELFSEIETW
jgi:hypothetical protein